MTDPAVRPVAPRIDLEPLKSALRGRERANYGRTHWEGCWTDDRHRDCAIAKLITEVESLRAGEK